jgi:hypothetical protein
MLDQRHTKQFSGCPGTLERAERGQPYLAISVE